MLGPNSVVRRTVVKPSMCGPYALFVGQVGDWTWETISELCDTNVFAATDADGTPTYLAFYYYHIRAGRSFHPGRLTFGDAIHVTSNAYNFGSESTLTLHKIEADDRVRASPIDCTEFYERPRSDCIYVQNFNRWIKRGLKDSNENLTRASPAHFQYEHLPLLPQDYSPRPVYTHARRHDTFLDPTVQANLELLAEQSSEYVIDLTRDVNGVGLIYFAAYFSIVEVALLRLWRTLGRTDRSFMSRVILDEKVCYLGNADIDATLVLDAKLFGNRDAHTPQVVNVVVRERTTRRRLAIATASFVTEQA